MAQDVGTGSTIQFGTSNFDGAILSIEQSGISREAIETTDLSTTGARTFIPGKLYDGGELNLEIAYELDKVPPYEGDPETITMRGPLQSGELTAAGASFTGFINNMSRAFAIEERMACSITIKVAGNITEIPATTS